MFDIRYFNLPCCLQMAGRLANNLKEDYLCCRICLNQFHKPKTLPCDHSFCEECIALHVSQTISRHRSSTQLVCPLCRHPIPANPRSFDVEAWVKTLPTDPLLESLLNTVHVHELKDSGQFATLPLLCEAHGGKPREAYCFTHAQLVCWECAARNHRQCEVDSSENAQEVVQATVNSLKETVSSQLSKARELGKTDRQFTESKAQTLTDIDLFERKLDSVYDSAKQQLTLLRNDVEHCTRLHLDEFKTFYDAVSQLLELNHTLEIIGADNQNTSAVLTTLEGIKQEVSVATTRLQQAESTKTKRSHYVSFVKDEHLNNFLSMYSSIGFIDSNIQGSGMEQNTPTPRDTPASISHILKRPVGKPSQTPKARRSKPAPTKK